MTECANSGCAEAITAIREELKAIHDAGMQDCVILIDDIRGLEPRSMVKTSRAVGHTLMFNT